MFTDKLAKDTDSFLSSALNTILNIDFIKPPASEMLQPNFTADRDALRARHVGLGLRPLTKRYLALNSLNNVMPQAINRRILLLVVSGTRLGKFLVLAHMMTTKKITGGLFSLSQGAPLVKTLRP